MRRINKYKLIGAVLVALIALASTYFTEKSKVPEMAEDEIFVHFIDVGEADCSFIELPDGKTMLIDAGEAENGEQVLKYIKDRKTKKIDFLVGTHPHADHIGGLRTIIEKLEIGKIYMPKVYHNSGVYEKLLTAIKEKGKTVSSPTAGEIIYENSGLTVMVLSSNDKEYNSLNDYSIVIKIDYKNTSFLFTGDAENEALSNIKGDVRADVLKVAHHGSYSSGDDAFMKRVKPRYAVIPVGKNNQYGHPHREILKLLEGLNTQVYRTDKDGTVIAASDGDKIEIYTLGEKNEGNN